MKKSSLTKILIDWARLFHDINLKNNGAIVIPRFSTVCGSVRMSFGDIGEKFTRMHLSVWKNSVFLSRPSLDIVFQIFFFVSPQENKLQILWQGR